MATTPTNRAGRRAAKKAAPKKPPLKVAPPADQKPKTVDERLAHLEATVAKLSQALAQVLAAQVAPAIQQQIQDKIMQELA